MAHTGSARWVTPLHGPLGAPRVGMCREWASYTWFRQLWRNFMVPPPSPRCAQSVPDRSSLSVALRALALPWQSPRRAEPFASVRRLPPLETVARVKRAPPRTRRGVVLSPAPVCGSAAPLRGAAAVERGDPPPTGWTCRPPCPRRAVIDTWRWCCLPAQAQLCLSQLCRRSVLCLRTMAALHL